MAWPGMRCGTHICQVTNDRKTTLEKMRVTTVFGQPCTYTKDDKAPNKQTEGSGKRKGGTMGAGTLN